MELGLRQAVGPGIDQPKQQSERKRHRADTNQLFERGVGKIEQDHFSRDDHYCYQDNRPRLQDSGSS